MSGDAITNNMNEKGEIYSSAQTEKMKCKEVNKASKA